MMRRLIRVDNQQRQAAESQLANCMNDNFPQFVMGMMEVLVNRSMDSSIRQMAGIVFKRAISTLVSLFSSLLIELVWRYAFG